MRGGCVVAIACALVASCRGASQPHPATPVNRAPPHSPPPHPTPPAAQPECNRVLDIHFDANGGPILGPLFALLRAYPQIHTLVIVDSGTTAEPISASIARADSIRRALRAALGPSFVLVTVDGNIADPREPVSTFVHARHSDAGPHPICTPLGPVPR